MVKPKKESLRTGAWELVLSKSKYELELASKGFIVITAKQLKADAKQEPRILAKMDFSSQRPKSFVDRKINIIPITNGIYQLGPFNIYKKLEKVNSDPILKSNPISFESLSLNSTSEGVVLRKAEIAEMISDFVGEQIVHTFSGRERSPKFSFVSKNYDSGTSELTIDGVQIEVDGGFEGKKNIYIFEVKNGSYDESDFNIRQLYFPYRTYRAKCKKPIRCIYLTHQDDVFTFREYEFKDPLNMSSATLIKSENYLLKKPIIELKKLIQAVQKSPETLVTDASYPQADSFKLVLEVALLAGKSGASEEEIISKHGLSARQMGLGGYYPSAVRYLGLGSIVKKGKTKYLVASQEYLNAHSAGYQHEVEFLAKRILSIPGVSQILLEWMDSKIMPDSKTIQKRLSQTDGFLKIGETTQLRRAQTIRAWCFWIIKHCK